MIRVAATVACLLVCASPLASQEKKAAPVSFDNDQASSHEIKPHRRSIPVSGAQGGFNQLYLSLTVSPTGDVLHAEATGDDRTMSFWPQVQGEIAQWKFKPFLVGETPVTAVVEEYVNLVPPERLPKTHIDPPVLRVDSDIAMTLQRSGCFGSCPSYTVSITKAGIQFDGSGYVVATGRHVAPIAPDQVRALAEKFLAADFYSMKDQYTASVTDNPTQVLTLSIDGRSKKVIDYVGEWVGMPAVISELEEEVDATAGTDRWIQGSDGLVALLSAEKYNFHTFDAQVLLKNAASRGMTTTVSELLQAGVPLTPLPAPKYNDEHQVPPFAHVGMLNAAASYPETLLLLIDAGASKDDQSDKDLALLDAAGSDNLAGVKALIAYGANPNADPPQRLPYGQIRGTVLIAAATSGDPEMIREILQYHPALERTGYLGQTALFPASEIHKGSKGQQSHVVACVAILAAAGANVNAQDDNGNTPLYNASSNAVREELLKLGADINTRNKKGETLLFTTYYADTVTFLIQHGANPYIRDYQGRSALDAAGNKGEAFRDALIKAAPFP